MSPRTVQQNELIRQVKRKQIMDAALELFAIQGFHTTSISEIAKKAGISKGLMYNYFESKDELLSMIMETGFDKLLQWFDPNHDGILTREELILYLNKILGMMKADPLYWRLYYSIILNPQTNTKVLMNILKKSESFFQILSEYFERKGSKNPMVETRFFVAMLDGVYLNAILEEEFPMNESLQIIIEKFV